jgi:serine/threonine-protein kinase
MATVSDPCDPRQLELLLHNRLPLEFESSLESHLSKCRDCRRRLDELAGGANWWSEVQSYLGGDGDIQSTTASKEDRPGAGEPIDLGFLQPPRRPGSLGCLGEYDVLGVLGRGGMGVVLKAFESALNRPVAIKVLAPEYAANATARKRFVREAQAAAGIAHEHLVAVYAVDANTTPPYLVMALISGQSLQQRIDRAGSLELKEILRISMQTAGGLAAAHAQGLVHRDIKPANIMLENGLERVRITDFGLARAVHDVSVTISGAVTGTPQYMAPEQARGEVIDQRADLFSLGSTMYMMCTGYPPFRGETPLAIVRQVCDVQPTPIRSLNPEIPLWLTGIIGKLQAKDPKERWSTAAEVSDLLERCLAHVQQPEHIPLPAAAAELGKRLEARTGTPRMPHRRHVALLAAAALTGLFIFVLLGRHGWLKTGISDSIPSGRLATDLAAVAELDQQLSEASDRLNSRLQRMGQAQFETLAYEDNAASDRATLVVNHAVRIRAELTSPDAVSDDPIASRLAAIRGRLERVRQYLGGSP